MISDRGYTIEAWSVTANREPEHRPAGEDLDGAIVTAWNTARRRVSVLTPDSMEVARFAMLWAAQPPGRVTGRECLKNATGCAFSVSASRRWS